MTMLDIAHRTQRHVVPISGWDTRGHGPLSDIRSVIIHHTAGAATGDAPSLKTVIDGRPDLDGPLCHYLISRAGVIYVVAAGLAYHAGVVVDPRWSNAHAIGIELEGTGTGPWPPVQIASACQLTAELCRALHLTVTDVRGHKEICSPRGRKIDPNYDMDAFRSAVAVTLRPKTTTEDDMTPEQAKQLSLTYQAVWGMDGHGGDVHDSAGEYPPIMHSLARLTEEVAKLIAKLDALESK